jgi:hypothetical protein
MAKIKAETARCGEKCQKFNENRLKGGSETV